MTQEAAEVVGDSRDRPAREAGETLQARGFDFGAKRVTYALIGVDAQHPVVRRGPHREVFLRAKARPVSLDHARTERARELSRGICRVRIHDDQLVAKGHRNAGRPRCDRFVVRDNAGGELCGVRWSSLGHLAILVRRITTIPPRTIKKSRTDDHSSSTHAARSRTTRVPCGTEAMGGSEATLARIADSLGALVVQHNRTETWGRYGPPVPLPAIERVVVNRDSRALPMVRRLYPHARVFLWLHDRVEPRSRRAAGWHPRPACCARPRHISFASLTSSAAASRPRCVRSESMMACALRPSTTRWT